MAVAVVVMPVGMPIMMVIVVIVTSVIIMAMSTILGFFRVYRIIKPELGACITNDIPQRTQLLESFTNAILDVCG